jgi:hypothetical protein
MTVAVESDTTPADAITAARINSNQNLLSRFDTWSPSKNS